MKITICGGGNLGHVCAAFLSSQSINQVSLLTTQPNRWSRQIKAIDCKGKIYYGFLESISDRPEDVIPEADLVLVCLPGYAIGNVLESVAQYLSPSCLVGSVVSSTGFFFEAFAKLPNSQPLFGFQRVPFISRIIQYGREAELKGYKESLSIAVEQTEGKDEIRCMLEGLFQTPIKLLNSHYEVSLSNSNPLLHTSRLYSLWHDWKPGVSYDRNPGFYSEWSDDASILYIEMDNEFQLLLKNLGLSEGSIPSVLSYYECSDVKSLTKKICSIPAFQGIQSPMLLIEDGKYIPDFHSRYFTEDFPYGMNYILNLAEKNSLELPIISRVYKWGSSYLDY